MRYYLSILALTLLACGDDDMTMMLPAADSGPQVSCSTTDGTTACGFEFCAANQWCESVVCSAGCQSSANCAAGTFCDKEGTTGSSVAGVCRPCNTVARDGGTGPIPMCTDVTGNYNGSVAVGNPELCDGLTLGTFSVTQAGTSVTLSGGGDGFSCELDSATCSCTGTFDVEGMSVSINWMPDRGRFTLTAGGIICNFNIVGPA